MHIENVNISLDKNFNKFHKEIKEIKKNLENCMLLRKMIQR